MQKYFKRVYRFQALLACGLLMGISQPALAAELALVIDDVGYSVSRGRRAIELPGAVTIAVLPFAPHTRQLVAHAALHGKDVILHQPMESQPSAHARREHDTLMLGMAPNEFTATFVAALDAVPARVGVSNHTGSLLTQHRLPMQHLMQQLQQRNLFFLDSRTTTETVALEVATELGVPALKRDVFLDHVPTTKAISQAFARAVQMARRKGHAVLIGHPYGITLRFLEQRLADLPADVRLVNAGDLARRLEPVSRPAVLAQPPHPTSLHISPGR